LSRTAGKLVKLLRGAAKYTSDNQLNRLGNGFTYEAEVRIDQVASQTITDRDVKGVGYVEEFLAEGRWEARVRKNKYAFNKIIEMIWSDDMNPYGFFTVRVRSVDGKVQDDLRLDIMVEPNYGEPDDYAFKLAEVLLRECVQGLSN
jgi:hypothetical protein